jgi:menaquinone-specific isochorismate synthase
MKAITRPLPAGPPIDPIRVCGERGVFFANHRLTLAGAGRAAVLALPGGLAEQAGRERADAWLRSVACDDPLGRPGAGPVAFGALPFELDMASALVVPAVTYGRDADGLEWVTVVGEDPLPAPTREWLLSEATAPSRIEPPAQLEITESLPADYRAAVVRATRAIAEGLLKKVVLARRLRIEASRELVASATLARLIEDEPSSTAFLVGHGESAFVGASPELLVSRRGAGVISHPLAGTAPLDHEASDRLLGSAKNLEEHELVVADIARVLDPLCSELVVPGAPSLVALHTMAHLGTRIEGQLMAEDGRVPSALELVAALHPTPAVGGVPRDEALALIAELEPGPRGPWAGPVGWVDARGDGDWMLGLRSATLSGSVATLWAGAGIVAASDADAELEETAVKLVPVLEGLAPGSSALLGAGSLR